MVLDGFSRFPERPTGFRFRFWCRLLFCLFTSSGQYTLSDHNLSSANMFSIPHDHLLYLSFRFIFPFTIFHFCFLTEVYVLPFPRNLPHCGNCGQSQSIQSPQMAPSLPFRGVSSHLPPQAPGLSTSCSPHSFALSTQPSIHTYSHPPFPVTRVPDSSPPPKAPPSIFLHPPSPPLLHSPLPTCPNWAGWKVYVHSVILMLFRPRPEYIFHH